MTYTAFSTLLFLKIIMWRPEECLSWVIISDMFPFGCDADSRLLRKEVCEWGVAYVSRLKGKE